MTKLELDNLRKQQLNIDEIYTLYSKYAKILAFKITNNYQMAEDAVHNAFLEIIKNNEKYTAFSNNNFRLIINRIVKNKAIDLIRKEKKYVAYLTDEIENKINTKQDGADVQIINKEEIQRILKLIMNLDELDRNLLKLRYLFKMSYKDISDVVNMSVKNVDMHLYRAKNKLRKSYNK